MTPSAVIQLIHSLSKAEKRQLKIISRRQSGRKDYIQLFDLVDKEQVFDKTTLVQKYRRKFPGSSLENTSRYLFKSIVEALIQVRTKDSPMHELVYGLLKVNILNERNLPEEGYKELERLKIISEKLQESFYDYIILRTELKYHIDNNFQSLTENKLIALQMKARDNIRQVRNTHEHFALYELLKFRLLKSGAVLNAEDKSKLNDLLLNEMSVVNSRVKHNVESKKLHLLFQSYFFTNTGDYKAALKTFYELNRLFEKYDPLLKNPPWDYYGALAGILDNLGTNTHFVEMVPYLSRLSQLDKSIYPEYFRFLVKKTTLHFSLWKLIGTGNYKEAGELVAKSEKSIWKQYPLVNEEKQNELLFYLALTDYHNKQFKKAQKFINEIVLTGKVNENLPVYKAASLLNLIMSYESKDFESLDYLIKNYKKAKGQNGGLMKTEKILIAAIKMNPDFNVKLKNKILWNKIKGSVSDILNNKHEKHLSKYFDFVGWVEKRFRQ